jgi:hypothetical protein
MASTPTPAMRKVIQDAEHWGDFAERWQDLSPESNESVSSKRTVLALVELGWLKPLALALPDHTRGKDCGA